MDDKGSINTNTASPAPQPPPPGMIPNGGAFQHHQLLTLSDIERQLADPRSAVSQAVAAYEELLDGTLHYGLPYDELVDGTLRYGLSCEDLVDGMLCYGLPFYRLSMGRCVMACLLKSLAMGPLHYGLR
jgi:hypothetical protein